MSVRQKQQSKHMHINDAFKDPQAKEVKLGFDYDSLKAKSQIPTNIKLHESMENAISDLIDTAEGDNINIKERLSYYNIKVEKITKTLVH